VRPWSADVADSERDRLDRWWRRHLVSKAVSYR